MPEPKVFKKISKSDISITPFRVYKEWEDITHLNYTSSYGIKIYQGVYPENSRYPKKILPISSSLAKSEPTTSDGIYRKVVYDGIKSYFYDEELDYYYPKNIKKHLYESASIMSIPQIMFGEKIKEKSIAGVDSSNENSNPAVTTGNWRETYLDMNFKDDGSGNIFDADIPTSSFASSSNLVAYWGFNDKYNLLNDHKIVSGNVSCFEASYPGHINNNSFVGRFYNTRFERGIMTTGYSSSYSGLEATFTGSGWIKVENNDKINPKKNDNFAISLWINIPTTQLVTSSNFNGIIGKQGEAEVEYLDRKKGEYYLKEADINLTKYPYQIAIYNQNTADSGKLWVGRSDGIASPFISSSGTVTGAEHHVVFQKSASILELYIDGALEDSVTDYTSKNCSNKCKFMMGSFAKERGNLSGSIDEIRYYNTYLTLDQIKGLSDNGFLTGSAYQTTRIGNVFYNNGIIVVSDPRPKYDTMFFGRKNSYGDDGSVCGFNLDFRSTKTIYEHRVLCRIRQDEFNMTLNPSARKNGLETDQSPAPFVSSSDWNPYITTVGLYDDYGRLLAVGKLAQPLPKRDDIDYNIMLRWDQ